ncbi:hypothetical protein J4714_11825 [Staphylococcus epidermidis]|nr:hypothetical protein [Staphylococcus epidermidis]MBO1925584.1 hypothetical protein [Staphylococcus epidermidis]MBO1925600.1 hypothetical protein [Staphylococcus epidermidis]MBO1996625.1 hypothetical protein [Staphylococcus epidermidis]MBO1996640.1 hypothetical protein [Staphylococcus epidermidis]
MEDFNELDVDNDFIMHPVGFGVRSMIQIRADFAKNMVKICTSSINENIS